MKLERSGKKIEKEVKVFRGRWWREGTEGSRAQRDGWFPVCPTPRAPWGTLAPAHPPGTTFHPSQW